MSRRHSLKEHQEEHAILGFNGSGSFTIEEGYPAILDPTRNKTLSISRNNLVASKNGKAQNVYLSVSSPLSKTAYRMPRNGTITAVAVQVSEITSFTLELRRSSGILYSTSVNSLGSHDKTVSADFLEGDIIKVRVSGIAHNPVIWFEFAWKF